MADIVGWEDDRAVLGLKCLITEGTFGISSQGAAWPLTVASGFAGRFFLESRQGVEFYGISTLASLLQLRSDKCPRKTLKICEPET